MDKTEIFNRIKSVALAEIISTPEELQLTENTLWKEFELDSIDSLNIIMALEYSLNILVPDSEINKFFEGSIGDSVEMINNMLKPFK